MDGGSLRGEREWKGVFRMRSRLEKMGGEWSMEICADDGVRVAVFMGVDVFGRLKRRIGRV